jgi:hypothetical protein
MGKNLIYPVTYRFLEGIVFFLDGIKQYIVNEIITGNGFSRLRFLRMKGELLLYLFNTVALSACLKMQLLMLLRKQ